MSASVSGQVERYNVERACVWVYALAAVFVCGLDRVHLGRLGRGSWFDGAEAGAGTGDFSRVPGGGHARGVRVVSDRDGLPALGQGISSRARRQTFRDRRHPSLVQCPRPFGDRRDSCGASDGEDSFEGARRVRADACGLPVGPWHVLPAYCLGVARVHVCRESGNDPSARGGWFAGGRWHGNDAPCVAAPVRFDGGEDADPFGSGVVRSVSSGFHGMHAPASAGGMRRNLCAASCFVRSAVACCRGVRR